MKEGINRRILILVFLCSFLILISGKIKIEFTIDLSDRWDDRWNDGTCSVQNFYAQVLERGYYLPEEQLTYNWPESVFLPVSLRDYFFEGGEIQYRVEGPLTISSIEIFWGGIKLCTFDANELYSMITPSDAALLGDGVVTFQNEEGLSAIFKLYGLRRQVAVRFIVAFFLLAAFFITFCILTAKLNLYAYISGHIDRIKRIPLISNILLAAFISLAIGKIFVIFSLEQWYVEKEELYCLFIAGAVVWTFLETIDDFSRKSNLKKILYFGVIMVCMSLSILYITSYFTIDEAKAIKEEVNLSKDIFRHWYMVNAHTNYLVMGTFFWLLPTGFMNNLDISAMQLAKIIHWFFGFLLAQGIVALATRKLLKEVKQNKLLQVLILYASIFTLQVFCLCMANYNYDLFSCVPGALAIIIIWYAYEEKSIKWATLSLIFAALATQEKIIAIPVVTICMSLWTFIYWSQHAGEKRLTQTIELLKGTAFSILISCGVCWFSGWWVSSVLVKGNISWTVGLERLTGQIFRMENLFTNNVLSMLGCGGHPLIVKVLGVITLAFILICGAYIFKLASKIHVNESATKLIARITAIGVVLFFVLGVAYNYWPAYFYEMEWKLVRLLCVYVYQFVISVPTFFSLLIIGWAIYKIKNPTLSPFRSLMVIFLYWGMAVLYSIMGDYISPRYMDLYILAAVVVSVILVISDMKNNKLCTAYRNVLILGVMISIIEVAPDAIRGYSSHRPLWDFSIYFDSNISMQSWGSLCSSFGHRIIRYCEQNDIDIGSVQIYTNYRGNWNDNIYDIPVETINSLTDIGEEILNDTTFFCIEYAYYKRDPDRFMNGLEIPFDEVEPIITFYYRGKPYAFIYTGEQTRPYWNR